MVAEKVNEVLTAEAKRRTLLMDICRDGIAIFNSRHQVVEANKMFADMLGYTEEEVLGLYSWEIDANTSEEEIRKTFDPDIFNTTFNSSVVNIINTTDTHYIFETQHRRKDGSLYDAEVSIAGSQIDDEFFFITISRDITERKKMYKQVMAANRAKSDFLANMNHEIRTPLSGIIGMLEVMKATPLNENQEMYIQSALQSCERLYHLLVDILELTKFDVGFSKLVMSPFSVKDEIEAIVQLFGPTAIQNNLELRSYVSPDIPDQLMGDVTRLQHVLVNLLSNAFKFTKEGHVALNVHLLPQRKEDTCHLLFSVCDTGIGIADDVLDEPFDLFVQGEEARHYYSRQYEGAGLGLAVFKRLVPLMGGTLAVESERGVGSAFYFCIPFQRA